jgi:ABC-type lipoprotein release transport system permease subunit
VAAQSRKCREVSIASCRYGVVGSITNQSVLDPIVLIAAPAFLATLTLCACFLPARRALRIDPARALRQE